MLRKAYPGGDAIRRTGIMRHVFSTQASSRNRAFWSFGGVDAISAPSFRDDEVAPGIQTVGVMPLSGDDPDAVCIAPASVWI